MRGSRGRAMSMRAPACNPEAPRFSARDLPDPFVVHDLEAEALALIQAGYPCAFDGTYIDQHVYSNVVEFEETIALTDVEPSDSSNCHSALPRMWRPPARRLARMKPARHAACASSHAASQARRPERRRGWADTAVRVPRDRWVSRSTTSTVSQCHNGRFLDPHGRPTGLF